MKTMTRQEVLNAVREMVRDLGSKQIVYWHTKRSYKSTVCVNTWVLNENDQRTEIYIDEEGKLWVVGWLNITGIMKREDELTGEELARVYNILIKLK